ncbi:MAG: hypothetical protein IPG72_02800 [Ardenticatenales bacterium]|nr:hypothetical protein [Ardenticatenales bacterium]
MAILASALVAAAATTGAARAQSEDGAAPAGCAAGAWDGNLDCSPHQTKMDDPVVDQVESIEPEFEAVRNTSSHEMCRLLADDQAREAAGCFEAAKAVDVPAPPGPGNTALNGLPMSFVANRGQRPAEVRFEVKRSGHSLFFTPDAVVFAAEAADGSAKTDVRMTFDGAADAPRVSGIDALPGVQSYFSGDKSVTGIPTFGGVRYGALYPGIDLTFSGQAGALKREFVVAPGADPSAIRMRYAGVTDIRVTDAGDLALETALSTLTEQKPFVYQEVAGRRVEVESAYAVDGRVVTFELGAYDSALPLVIDPIFQFSTVIGTTASDIVNAQVLDAAGNVYIVGLTNLATFPTGGTSTTFGTNGGQEAFAAKLTPDLSTLLYSVVLASSSTDSAIAASIQPGTTQLDIFGTTLTSNFPVCTGFGLPFATCTGAAFDTTFNGGADYFVARLNAAGTGLLGSTYLGGTSTEQGVGGIDTYANGDVWVVGSSSSTNYPFLNPFAGTQTSLTAGSTDPVITGLRADHTLTFASGYLGGNTTDQAFAVTIDQSGLDFHVAGVTFSSTFPICTGAGTMLNGNVNNSCTVAGFDTSFNSSSDSYVMRIANTLRVVASTYVGGTSTDQFFAVDRIGDDTVAFGNTLSNPYPTTLGAFDTTFNTGADYALTRLNGDLSSLVYSTYIGGSGTEGGRGIDLDAANQAHVTGFSSSANFPVLLAPDGTLTTANDATVTKVTADGSALLYSTYLGAAGNENGLALDVSANGNTAYVAGLTSAATFPTTPGAFDTTHNGSNDGFVTAVSLAPIMIGVTTFEDLTKSVPGEDCLGSGDHVLVTVSMTNAGDLPATSGTYTAAFPQGLVGDTGSCSDPGCAVTPGGVSANFTFAPPLAPGSTFVFTYRVYISGGTFGRRILTVVASGSFGANGITSSQDLSYELAMTCPPQVDPNSQLGKQVHLPILNFQGQDDVCESWIEVQNLGCRIAKAALVTWGEPGFCPPQAAGPLKVECTGLIKPGSTWNLYGAQVPTGSKSGILFKLSARQLSEDGIDVIPEDDITGDYVCEVLFFNVVGDADDYRRFKKAYNEGLVFDGIDMVRASGDGLLAVDVHRSCPGDATPGVDVTSKYNGLAGTHLGTYDEVYGGYSYYVPLVYASAAGFNTIIYIQNGGLMCSSLEIWFKARDDCLRATICDIATLAPGETYQLDANDCVGPDFQGSAWIRSTQVMGIAVDIIGGDVLMTYVGEPGEINYTFDPDRSTTKDGNQVGFAPLTYSEYQGWDAGIQVQNLSAVFAAKVKIYFLDRSGDIVTTLVDWVCPRGSQTFFLPVVYDLPGNWVGSARAESQEWITPGGPNILAPNIVGIVTLIKYTDVARTSKTEAIAYNMLPEHKIYDWQIGSIGGGLDSGVGLIAIPSVLRDLENSGLTSEIAIANVVPKPGFTDLVIYFYDQNGLLDYICQKLNEKQVEYIDLQTWGYINDGFKGSAIISAWFWEHDVFDDEGVFLRNLVGLGAVSIERKGTHLGEDVPGDESAGDRGIPFAQTYDEEGEPVFEFCFMGPAPLCPGFPDRRPQPGDGPACISAPLGDTFEATSGQGSGYADWLTYQANTRVFRDGVASTCNPKACPGTSGGGGNFDLYYFNNCDRGEHCFTVTVNTGTCTTNIHGVAFAGEVPDGSAFACQLGDAVYVGDLGSSLSQPFSFTIPAGTARWTLMFHNNFGAATCDYSFVITEN